MQPRSGAAEEGAERLALVTYLPGFQPPDRADHSREAHPSAHRPRPTFAAMYDSDDENDDTGEYGEPVDDSCALLEAEAEARRARERDGDSERAAELARAENVSMHALTRRGQSRRELERTLRSREISDEVISLEIERLERVGLIDDIALAQNLVGVLQERKGLGRTGIAGELARRMLSPAAIEYALELIDTGDELARARELAVKRARQLSSYDRETAQRRLSGYLARRGYSGSTVRAAVEHALSQGPSARGVRFR